MKPNQIDRREYRREMLLNEPIYKVIPKMAIPTMISGVVMAVYSLTDTIFVSSLGTAATAAVGVNSSLMMFIQMAGSALAIGANSYIARLLGAKKDRKAESVLSTAFFTALGTGLIVMIIGSLFMNQLVSILGARDQVVPYAIDYASYILYAAPFMTAAFVMNQCLRAEGSAVLSMIGMVAGAGLNVILDPIFIFTLDMGVAGASLATAISKFTSFIILIIPYITKKSLLHLSIKKVSFSRDIVGEISKMGFPTLVRSGLMMISSIVTNNVAGGFSDSALAAMSVVTRVMMFFSSMTVGFGQGFQVVAGFNWGAKRYDRVHKAFKFASIIGVAFVSLLALLAALFAKPIINIFTDEDLTMISLGVFAMVTQCIATPMHAWVLVVNSLYTALGKATGAALLSLARQGLFLIPSVAILSLIFKENGLAVSQAVSDVLSLTLGIPFGIKIWREVKSHEAGRLKAGETAAELPEGGLPDGVVENE